MVTNRKRGEGITSIKTSKKKRGERMNSNRKKIHVMMKPVVAMKICGPIALGDQTITSKCLRAHKDYKERFTGQELQDKLREHLYKDIQRLIIKRIGVRRRETEHLTRYWDKQYNKVAPRFHSV